MGRRFAPIRGFEQAAVIPQRKTAGSAGYDLAAAADVTVPPGKVTFIPTGLKAYMGPGEVLVLTVRSSLAVSRGLMLANGVGVIDSDYVDNPDNEGHIMVAVLHFGAEPITIHCGERIAQGLFLPYLTTDEDKAGGARTGGFGSTGKR